MALEIRKVLLVCQNARAAIPSPCFHRHMAIDHKAPSQYGPNGFYLCRWCGEECENKRRTFCRRGDCVTQFTMRTGGGYMRSLVYRRDKGVCQKCGFDTEKAKNELRRFDVNWKWNQGLTMREWMIYTRVMNEKGKQAAEKYIAMGFPSHRSDHWWEAEHIIPVVEGGGCCGLDNMTTLCLPCHRASTKALAQRRKAARSFRPEERLLL